MDGREEGMDRRTGEHQSTQISITCMVAEWKMDKHGTIHRWMDERKDGWRDRQMDGGIDGWMDSYLWSSVQGTGVSTGSPSWSAPTTSCTPGCSGTGRQAPGSGTAPAAPRRATPTRE